MDDQQKLREAAWATLKQMHEDLAKPKEPVLYVAGGWCAPSTVTYLGSHGPEIVFPLPPAWSGTYVGNP